MRPPAARANIALEMRTRARSKKRSSIIAGVPHQLADELDEAGDDAEEEAGDIDPVRVKGFVERIPDDVAEEGGDGEHEGEGGILADEHGPGFFGRHYG